MLNTLAIVLTLFVSNLVLASSFFIKPYLQRSNSGELFVRWEGSFGKEPNFKLKNNSTGDTFSIKSKIIKEHSG